MLKRKYLTQKRRIRRIWYKGITTTVLVLALILTFSHVTIPELQNLLTSKALVTTGEQWKAPRYLPQLALKEDITVEEHIREIARQEAFPHVDWLVKIAICESSLGTNLVGDNNSSFGTFQIHLPAHPDVTKEQAMDLDFATRWTINEVLEFRQWQWSCDHKVKGVPLAVVRSW